MAVKICRIVLPVTDYRIETLARLEFSFIGWRPFSPQVPPRKLGGS